MKRTSAYGNDQHSALRINEMLSFISDEITSIDKFCSPSSEVYEKLLLLLKNVFDVASSSSAKRFGPFSELMIEGLDFESIWEVLQARNRPLIRYLQKTINRLSKVSIAKPNQRNGVGTVAVDFDAILEEYSTRANESQRLSRKEKISNLDYGRNDDDRGNGNANLSNEVEGDDKPEVDDSDPNSDECSVNESENEEDIDNYLDQTEELEELHMRRQEQRLARQGQKGATEDDDDEVDDIDLVQRILYGEENDDDEGVFDDVDSNDSASHRLSEKNAKHDDFFGKVKKSHGNLRKPVSSSDHNKRSNKSLHRKRSSLRQVPDDDNKALHDNEDFGTDEEVGEGEDSVEAGEGGSDDDVDNDDGVLDFGEDEDAASDADAEDLTESEAVQTKLTKRRLKLAEELAELEAAALGPKSWELRGEVRGLDRPLNSLLQLPVQAERASKPKPIITQEHSNTLEDLIRKRIKDSSFNDVQPLQRVVEKSRDDGPELSQEKSKKGLGEIYADEFRKQAMGISDAAADGAPDAAEVELRALFDKVCRQLDALSHFNYCPKPVVREAAVTVSALPALSLEDVGPAHESHADTKAPEEVLAKKRGRAAALLSEQELTREDRKRLRLASKNANSSRKRLDAATTRNGHSSDSDSPQNSKSDRNSNKRSRNSRDDDREFSNNPRVKVVSNDERSASMGNSYKSADFFNRLQQEATQKIAKFVSANGKDGNEASGNSLKSSQIKL